MHVTVVTHLQVALSLYSPHSVNDPPTGVIITVLTLWPMPHGKVWLSAANGPPAGVVGTCQWPTSRCGWHLPMTLQQVWLAPANDPPAGVVGTLLTSHSPVKDPPAGGAVTVLCSCQRPTLGGVVTVLTFLPMTHSRCDCESSHPCQWPRVGAVVTVLTFLPGTHSRCGCDCPHIPANDPQ